MPYSPDDVALLRVLPGDATREAQPTSSSTPAYWFFAAPRVYAAETTGVLHAGKNVDEFRRPP